MGLLTMKLSDDDHESLRQIAAERGVTMTDLVRDLIRSARSAPAEKCPRCLHQSHSGFGCLFAIGSQRCACPGAS